MEISSKFYKTSNLLEPGPQGSPGAEAASKRNSKQQTTIGPITLTAQDDWFFGVHPDVWHIFWRRSRPGTPIKPILI